MSLRNSGICISVAILVLWAVPMDAQKPVGKDVLDVSLVQLIATPDKFNGKIVQVQGFLDMGFEGDFLYLHKIDADNLLFSNSIVIERSKQAEKGKFSLNNKYVFIVGTFRVALSKHLLTQFNGITDVQSIRFLSDPNNPAREKLRQLNGNNSGP